MRKRAKSPKRSLSISDEPEVRIQKYLSRAGVASRREAERLVLQGRVRINGNLVLALGSKVLPGKDQVEVNGELVQETQARWILVHKPPGVVTTRSDPQGRPTVYGLLPQDLGDLRYVGRLDQPTEGLLLLTNEGDTLHKLTHPSFEVEREYHAWVKGVPKRDTLAQLQEGVELEDGPAKATRAKVIRPVKYGALLALVLQEGRKREVRRLLEAVGHPVTRLVRVRFGPIRLGELPAGQWRDLTTTEIQSLKGTVRSENRK
jgi:23S rRNA pseudouridine2605 synthase